MFSAFIQHGFSLCKENGFNTMVTMQSWMFLSNYNKLRNFIFDNYSIFNLLHLDGGVMISFGTSATIFRKTYLPKYITTYNYIQTKDIENSEPKIFPTNSIRNKSVPIKHFLSIPGNPIAYWINDNIFDIFDNGHPLEDFVDLKQGLKTGDTKKYVKKWYEVNYDDIGIGYENRDIAKKSLKKWFPVSDGGNYKKWYGNNENVVYWYDDGYEIRNLFKPNGKLKSRPQNMDIYFKEGLTWSALTKKLSVRVNPIGNIISGAGYGIFNEKINKKYILGLLNSKISPIIVNIFSETFNVEVGTLKRIPIIVENENEIVKLVDENIKLAFDNWNQQEISYNFIKHPFLFYNDISLKKIFDRWSYESNLNFNNLKNNEEKLNKIFTKIYSLENEVDFEINDEDVSFIKANYQEDVKSFISYVVGCMFGRYSLDAEGLQYAGGVFDKSIYSTFKPDDDNIIPVLDTEYFDDDIVGRFVEFIKISFGEDSLEENLEFISNALGKKGSTSREKIRNYFLDNFYNNHVQTYKKCPIYWQFDSGKQNAFKCLIYMHRYDPSIVARVRTDYLHKTQKAIELNLSHCDNIISNSTNKSEVSKATKDKSKYIKQLDEIKVYDEALRHMATQNIEIDLDDGVKDNYKKFQKIEISIEGEKPKKINLLKNI